MNISLITLLLGIISLITVITNTIYEVNKKSVLCYFWFGLFVFLFFTPHNKHNSSGLSIYK